MRPDELMDVRVPAPRKAPRYQGPLVYFVQEDRGGPIKIGKTTGARLRQRIGDLQVAHSSQLVVRRLVRADKHADLERDLHDLLADYRLRGEWFRDEGLVREFARTKPDFPEVIRIRGRIVSIKGVPVEEVPA